MGDIAYTVVVRDLAGNPLIGSLVTIDFSACPLVTLCSLVQDPGYVVNYSARTVRASTDATGSVTFQLRAGGGCASQALVYADGVLLATIPAASPDQNGDQMVVANDYYLFAAKLGTTDLSGDFDCNGLVDESDGFVWSQHGSHSCYGIVNPVRRQSWGRVKSFYR
ncbi:MAG: hypothetical protein ABIU54_13875 [Candidatus Eisenbacteria bacterium]